MVLPVVFHHLTPSLRSIVDLLTSLHEPAAEDLAKSCLLALENAVKLTRESDGNFTTKFSIMFPHMLTW
jgi:hypothetical protein